MLRATVISSRSVLAERTPLHVRYFFEVNYKPFLFTFEAGLSEINWTKNVPPPFKAMYSFPAGW